VIALPEAEEGEVLTAPYSASGVSLCCAVSPSWAMGCGVF